MMFTNWNLIYYNGSDNISFLELFLDRYIDHIENYESLIYILSLLPPPYQYEFARNMVRYDNYLIDGSLIDGIIPEGIISVKCDRIILENDDLEDGKVTLLELPEAYDLI